MIIDRQQQVGVQESGRAASLAAGYEAQASERLDDPAWDAFLSRTAGGYFAQAGLWAQVKAPLGWQALRVVATRDGEIAGGVQMLVRPLSLLGAIGYAARGPLTAGDDPALAGLLVDELCQAARRRRIHVLVVQPPDERTAAALQARGFRLTPREVAPAYTLLLDLEPELDDLLAGMDRGTRYNVRLSKRKGIVVREGAGEDVPTFHRMLRLTSERQGFAISNEAYYQRLWDVFSPGGHAALFVAEVEGEPVSAQLALRFGDVAINKMTVWAGTHSQRKPNEAVLWAAIEWAKRAGCRTYDFGGLSAKGARVLLRGEPLPEKLKGSVTSFKLGFGGEVVEYPAAYIYATHPILRWADQKVLGDVETSSFAKKLLHRFRTQ